MKHRQFDWLRRFLRWLFGNPIQALPPEFGDPVPSDWRVFEAEAAEVQRRPQGNVPSSDAHRGKL